MLLLDTRVRQPWEIMAELHIRLAYPDADPARRERLIKSVCADYIATFIENRPERREELLNRFPQYDPAIRVGRKHLTDHFEQAQQVGVIVLALIKETVSGSPNLIDGKPRKVSRDFAIRYSWPQVPGAGNDQYDTWVHDIEKREFRARFPVAHLAAALEFVARQREAAGEVMTFQYDDYDFLRRWIAIAQEMAGYICMTPELAKPNGMASKLLDIRLVERPAGAEPFILLNE